jgi:hypothetical protein
MPTHKIKITETNGITGQTIERDANDAELAQLKVDSENQAINDAASAEKAAAKTALLERLGITADEAALLIG